jgi:hypothetical protein
LCEGALVFVLLRFKPFESERGHLLEANLQLEVARHLVRLANAWKLFSNHTYGVLAENMDEVGRMIGGWLKSVSGVRATPGAVA